MKSKALRRHHVERKKAKAVTILLRWGWSRASQTPASLGKVASTPHPCSCMGCGNPRRHLGELTMQECRAVSKIKRIDQKALTAC